MEFTMRRFSISIFVVLMSVIPAKAHFVFVRYGEHDANPQARLFFAESATSDAELLPKAIESSKVRVRLLNGSLVKLKGVKIEHDGQTQIVADLDDDSPCSIEADCTYGIYHGFLLKYYAKHVHYRSDQQLKKLGKSPDLALDIEVEEANGNFQVTVSWQSRPVPNASLTVTDPSGHETKSKTDELGRLRVPGIQAGLYEFRANFVEDAPGKFDNVSYASVHHYSTLTLRVEKDAQNQSGTTPKIPEALASFGAVACDDWLYVYGGHIGEAHDHSRDNLSEHFWRRPFEGGEWEELPMQTPVQGLALVAHGGFVYRIGGMTARNSAGEDAELYSTADFCRFDPTGNQWTAMPSLPEGRSSHDAVLVGDRIYVCGGWKLNGGDSGDWQKHSIVFDLSDPHAKWERFSEQPFQRRALAVSHLNGKLVVVGGMNAEHEIDRSVDVFDSQIGRWMNGPKLPGSGMNGFGVSAWNNGAGLYVSGTNGIVYRLRNDMSGWDELARLATPRFFHQLVSHQKTMLAIGGASTEFGHLDTIETVNIPAADSSSKVTPNAN